MTLHPIPDAALHQRVERTRRADNVVFPDRFLLFWAVSATLAASIIASAVHGGYTASLDRMLFDAVHGGTRFTPATAAAWWNEAVRDVTALGGTTVLTGAVIASGLYLFAAGRYRLCALLVSSALAATVFSGGVKLLFGRARPQTVEQLIVTTSASFPSGHALLSAAILLTIGGLVALAARARSEKRIIVWTAVIVTVSVGLSRVWLGVHWPSDVLAGWLYGSAWAALTILLAKRVDWPSRPWGQPSL